VFGVAAMISFLVATAAVNNISAPRPHVVAILADDLGFYDTAIYNPNSPTPQIAALAAHGLRLDRHYVFRYLRIPLRSMLTSTA
jgi:arylsulfatase A-like enzyme